MRGRLFVVLIALAAGAWSAVAVGTSGGAVVASSTQCAQVRIAGRATCLVTGQRCLRRYEQAYRRHGFTCSARSHRLTRLHSPGPASPPTSSTTTPTSITSPAPAPPVLTTTSSTTSTTTTTSGSPVPAFSCPTEAGVNRENDCPPADLSYPPPDFCSTHICIANFYNGRGTAVQCNDGEWSMSGGLRGACSYHGGESSNPPGPPPIY